MPWAENCGVHYLGLALLRRSPGLGENLQNSGCRLWMASALGEAFDSPPLKGLFARRAV
jgi:hypothetical protein